MKRGGGKRKGSAFERWAARQLSLWLTGGADYTQLIRSVSSGGWTAGRTSTEAWRNVGDLAPNGPAGERFRETFAVECKHHRRIDLWALWTHDDGGLLGQWWGKLQKEIAASPRPSLRPLLVFRANRVPTMVATQAAVLTEWHLPGDVNVAAVAAWDMVVFPLDGLLRCPPLAHWCQ